MRRSTTASKKSRLPRACCGAALAALLVASCATAPPSPEFSPSAWAASGQGLVLRLEAPQLQVIRDLGQEHPSWEPVLKRVQTLWLSFPEPQPGQGLDLNGAKVVLEGNFPPLETSWALFWNRPPAPWVVTQPRDGIVVAQPGAVSWGAPPQAQAAEWQHHDVRLVFTNPGPTLLGPLASRLLPIRNLVLELQAQTEELRGQVRLKVADNRAAEAALVALRLFGDAVDERLGQTLEWSVDGDTLIGQPFVVPQKGLLPWVQNLLQNLKEQP